MIRVYSPSPDVYSIRLVLVIVTVGLAVGFLSAQAGLWLAVSLAALALGITLIGAAGSVVRAQSISLPRVALFFMLFGSFINFDSSSSVGVGEETSIVGLARLLLRLTVVAASIALFVLAKRGIANRTVLPALLFFCFVTLVSAVLSNGVVVAFARWWDLAAFLVLVGLIGASRVGASESILREVYVVCVVVLGGLWLWYAYDPEPLTRMVYVSEGMDTIEFGRLGGSVVPPNTMGMLGTIVAILGIHHFRLVQIPSLRMVHLGAIVLAVSTLMMSGSRGALIGLGAAAVWMVGDVVFSLSRTCQRLVSSFIFLVIAGYFSFSFLSPYLRRTSGDDSPTSLAGRTDLWTMALEGFFGRPAAWFTGNSFGRIPNLQTPWGFTTDSPHNGYLLILLGSGLLGFIGVMWIWYLIIQSIPKIPAAVTRSSLGGIVIALMVHNVTEIGAFATMNLLTVVAGALIIITGWQLQTEGKDRDPRRG